MIQLYLEDFFVGQTFRSDRLRIDEERIRSFAAEFDPQPVPSRRCDCPTHDFSSVGSERLAYCCSHHAPAVESELRYAGGVVGAGFDELLWPQPVRPDDELRIRSEVLEVRPSKSRPDFGLIKVRTTILNQNGEAVQISIGNLLVLRRPK